MTVMWCINSDLVKLKRFSENGSGVTRFGGVFLDKIILSLMENTV